MGVAFLRCVVVSCLLVTCWGRRFRSLVQGSCPASVTRQPPPSQRRTQPVLLASSALECPSEAIENVKGDCVDAESNVVPLQCCRNAHDCKEEIQGLMASHDTRLSLYTNDCALEESDVAELDGQPGAWTIADNQRICAPQCQEIQELSTRLDPVDLEALRAKCADPASNVLLEQLESTVAIVDTLDEEWQGCTGMASGPICRNSETWIEVPQRCCDCAQSVEDSSAVLYEEYLTYVTQCGLRPNDIDSDGRIVDSTRLCSTTCLSLAGKVNITLRPTQATIDTLKAQCPERTTQSELEQLEAVKQFLESLDAAATQCSPKSNDDYIGGGQCPDRSMTMHDCSPDRSIHKSACESQGCCWDEPDNKAFGRPWCYKKSGDVLCQRRCPGKEILDTWDLRRKFGECSPFEMLEKVSDPDPHVRGRACESLGCCWHPLGHGSTEPWCIAAPCFPP